MKTHPGLILHWEFKFSKPLSDGVHDLDCFGKHSVTFPEYFCTWKPGRGSSVKTYTLYISYPGEWSRISLSLRKMDFIKCLTLKSPILPRDNDKRQTLPQHHRHLSKHHGASKPQHECGAFWKEQLGHLHKSRFSGVNAEPRWVWKKPKKTRTKRFFKMFSWGEFCLNDRKFGFSVRCDPPDSVSFSRFAGRIAVNVTWKQVEMQKIGHFAVNYSSQGSWLSQVSAINPLWPWLSISATPAPLWASSNLSRCSSIARPSFWFLQESTDIICVGRAKVLSRNDAHEWSAKPVKLRTALRNLPLIFGRVSPTAAAAVWKHHVRHGGGCEPLSGLHRAGTLREQQWVQTVHVEPRLPRPRRWVHFTFRRFQQTLAVWSSVPPQNWRRRLTWMSIRRPTLRRCQAAGGSPWRGRCATRTRLPVCCSAVIIWACVLVRFQNGARRLQGDHQQSLGRNPQRAVPNHRAEDHVHSLLFLIPSGN